MDSNVAVITFSFINTKNILYAMKCEKETEGRPTRQKNKSNKVYTCTLYLPQMSHNSNFFVLLYN